MAAKRPKVKPEKSTLKYKKTSAQTRTAKKPPKTSAGKAEGASKGKTPKARKVSKTPKSTVAEYNKPTGKPAAKTPKVKTSGAVKKAVTPVATRGLVRSMIGFGVRAVPPVAAGVAGALALTGLVSPIMRRLFPKSEPWKSTPKLRASQKRMNKAMGYGRDPEMEIHGGGSLLGLQVDEAKKAGLPTTMPSPIPRPPTKKKESTLGKTKPRLTRPKKEVYTTELRIPPKLDKITNMGEVKDTRVKKSSTRKTDPASADGPGSAPKRLNENASPTKGKTNIKDKFDKDRFDKFRQDSSRGDRHLGAPKKKPLGMEDAFWDGASWVR